MFDEFGGTEEFVVTSGLFPLSGYSQLSAEALGFFLVLRGRTRLAVHSYTELGRLDFDTFFQAAKFTPWLHRATPGIFALSGTTTQNTLGDVAFSSNSGHTRLSLFRLLLVLVGNSRFSYHV